MKRLSRMWEEKLPGRLQKRFEPHRAGAVGFGALAISYTFRKHPDMLPGNARWNESMNRERNVSRRKTAEAFTSAARCAHFRCGKSN